MAYEITQLDFGEGSGAHALRDALAHIKLAQVNYDMEQTVGGLGKNKLHNTAESGYLSSTTRYFINEDGSITIKAGKSTARKNIVLMDNVVISTDMVLSGCTGGGASTYKLQIVKNDDTSVYADNTDGDTAVSAATFNSPCKVQLVVYNNATFAEDITLYPMLRPASVVDSSYAPFYKKIVASDIGAIPTTDKGVANGVAILGSDGKVPSAQLPSVSSGKVSVKTAIPQFNDRLVSKSWSGISNPAGYWVWTDGKDVYYSQGSDQFVLDVDTGVWSPKTWNGDWLDVEGDLIWTDGESIYASISGDTVELDRDTSTWSLKEWSDGRYIDSTYSIWTDGEDIYYKNTHMLDKANDRWIAKSFSGINNFDAQYVWNDGKNTYYSHGNDQYVLDKANNTWVPKVWGGLNNFEGAYVWTDGEDIYYSGGSVLDQQYVLDKASDTWVPKTWYGLVSDSDLYGNAIWTDGKDIYFPGATALKFDIKKPKFTKLH